MNAQTLPAVAGPLEATVRNAPEGWDAEFLAKRLGRVARLVGVQMPDGLTHEQVAEVAGTILGQIAASLEWQSIETAPKDGTRIIVWWNGIATEAWCAGVGISRDGGDWWRSHSLTVVNPDNPRPTHWRPMPPPPSNAGVTGAEPQAERPC